MGSGLTIGHAMPLADMVGIMARPDSELLVTTILRYAIMQSRTGEPADFCILSVAILRFLNYIEVQSIN